MSNAVRKSFLMIIFLLGATIPGCIFTDTVEFDKCEDKDNCLIIAFEAKEEYKNTEESPQKLADRLEEVMGVEVEIYPVSGPAATIAALMLLKKDPKALILLLPSDHTIENQVGFQNAISVGAEAALGGYFVTFGIEPEEANTGYGYIHRSTPIQHLTECYSVRKFVEKPDLSMAEYYVSTGTHYWNSGIFLFKASKYLEELKSYLFKISDEALYAYNVYQIEGEGRKLFSNIEGDRNTIMGLPIKKIKEYLNNYK